MGLQQINWTQIDTINIPSGSVIDLGSISGSLHAVYTQNLFVSGIDFNTVISGFTESNIWKQTGSYFATTNNLQISGSLSILGGVDIDISPTNLFLIKSGSLNLFQVDNNGVITMNQLATAPTPISGGIYFDKVGNLFIGG